MLSSDSNLGPVRSSTFDTPLQDLPASTKRPTKGREPRDYLFLLLKRKWLILSVVSISTTVVALYALSLPSIYESSATLQLEAKEYVYTEDTKGTVFRSYNNYDYQNTQIRLLSNPHLARKVVLKLHLDQNPKLLESQEKAGVWAGLQKVFGRRKNEIPAANAAQIPTSTVDENVNDLSPERISQLEPYVGAVTAGLKIKPVDGTSLVTVSMTHTDPQLAMQVVDCLTRTFVTDNTDYETKGSQDAAETLGRQIAELQTKIKRQEDSRLNYLKSHNLPLAKGDGRNLTTDRLGKLSSQLLDAENERKEIEANYQAATSANDPSTLPAAKESQEIQDMRKTLHQLEQKRASLLQTYTSEWPEVKRIDAELRQIRDDISLSSRETITSLRSKLDAAVAREAKLRDSYYKEQAAANTQTSDEVELASLNQQIETNRQVYNMLIQRQTEMQVNSLDKSSHVGIVTPPVAAVTPIGPPRLNRIGFAFVLSLLAGLGLAVLLNQLDTKLTSAEDVMVHTSLVTLALIPTGGLKPRRPLRQRVLRRFAELESGNALQLTSDVRSPTAEAYRHLRASLLFTAGAPRTVLVTSGRPYEGKTTTAINTAVTFAQSGARVLLMDCDLRRPRVHRHFDLENSEGLTNFLAGRQDVDSLMVDHEAYPKLKVITAGPRPANPADFLGSPEMRNLLKVVSERFDHVIIDSP